MSNDKRLRSSLLNMNLTSEVIAPSEHVKEQVKHHSMVLFGLACDLSQAQEKCLIYEQEVKEFKAKYFELYREHQNLKLKYSRACKRIRDLLQQ